MSKYVAFLRAINVSGSRIIKMADLKQLLTDIGLKNVTTYIQSGNVIFEHRAADNKKLANKIEKGLMTTAGFEVEVFVRTAEELAAIAEEDPYKDIEDDGNAVVYVGFFADEPEQDKAELLTSFNNNVDTCIVKGTEVYILRYRDKGKAKFENKLIETKLKQLGTMRNRKTIFKMLDLCSK